MFFVVIFQFDIRMFSDMTPDYDILNADVLMGEGIKIEPSSPIRQHHQPQRQPQSHQLQQPIIQQFVMEASPQKSVQQPKAVVKTQQGVRKQVVRPAGMQMTTIKSPEFKQFDYVHATNVTIAAAPPAAVQPITTMTTATVNMVDTKPRIKILKKVATGGISNGIATHSIATNLTTTTISPATTMATTLTTMKDASGTIVINKSNGNFAGTNFFRRFRSFVFSLFSHIPHIDTPFSLRFCNVLIYVGITTGCPMLIYLYIHMLCLVFTNRAHGSTPFLWFLRS